ncbi:MAG: iron-containing alcohol dehydrogenase [Bacteroidota bacterium]
MQNFDVVNPTRILFGKDQYQNLPSLISSFTTKSKIMIAYGGGSIFKNGIYDKVADALSNYEIIQFGGIEANPQFHTLMKAAEICKTENIDFILAVGGGSVIDGVKFICGATKYDGDAWDVLLRKEGCVFKEAISFGTVLTLPATGSEANSGAVISRDDIKEKRTMGGPLFFPKFSICDPTAVASLPKRQIANGIVDAFMHTLEQYLTFPTDNLLQEREAEGILSTLIEIGPKVQADPSNYKWASNLMWCATHALNGNLRCGVATDWTTHMIGHELTALYGIDHARTLAIIAPRLYQNQFENKKEKLVQYGTRVWGLTGDADKVANEAIEKTESFFQDLGIDTKISAYTQDYADLAKTIQKRFQERGWLKMGERQAIEPKDVFEIVEKSI